MSANNEILKCECGSPFITKNQLNSHKAHCNEATEGLNSITEDRCTLWRKLLPTYDSLTEMSEDFEHCTTTIRRHVSSKCNHNSFEFYWEWTGGYWEARQK